MTNLELDKWAKEYANIHAPFQAQYAVELAYKEAFKEAVNLICSMPLLTPIAEVNIRFQHILK